MPYADPLKEKDCQARYKREHPEDMKVQAKRDREKLKAEVIDAYGGRCACCGESHIVFLTIDHPNGDGAERRRIEGHKGGTQQYRKLRKEGFPPGYRVLCWNCNAASHILGVCPHLTDEFDSPSLHD